MHESSAITKRLTVDELVTLYEQSVADVRHAFETIAKAEQRMSDAFRMEHRGISLRTRYGSRGYNFDDVEDVLFCLRMDVWRCIVERLELRRMMSVQRWTELERQIAEGAMPEITASSVREVLNGFASSLDTMLTEATQEVFGFLRPPAWDRYKTNERNAKFELKNKVILSGWVRVNWLGTAFEPNYHYEQRLTALENVFSALDGRGSITKGHYSDLSQAIRKADTEGRGETRYFAFRCFKNGNLHLQFKRADLVKKLNQIAGGKHLRSSVAA